MIRNRIGGGRGNRTILLLALFLGLVSAVLVYVYLSQAGGEEKTAASGDTKAVLVAKSDIPAATRITADMVEMRQISADAVHPDSFSSTEGVVGNMARYPIAAGEQVLSDRVATGSTGLLEGEELSLPYIVPEGKRAVSVRISDLIGAGGLLRPGDYVDVVLTVELQYGDQIGRIVLQNMEVLALDQEMENVAPESAGSEQTRVASTGSETKPEAVTVTLAVTPVESEVLATADECAENFSGRLALALRPFGDHDNVEVRPTWSETGSVPLCSQMLGIGLQNLRDPPGESGESSQ